MNAVDNRLIRIGVFYDGGYFHTVSNYYRYVHARRKGLSINGIHKFVCQQTAIYEEANERCCRVVDAHYFRGRYSLQKTLERNKLQHERTFDDVLMRAGVVTHYLPRNISDEEKGIDVWFALEAFELAVHKRFNVIALVACDSDYLPLIRKLNALGTRVMLLAWDFKYTDENGYDRETRTAQSLIDEATYPLMMHETIDDRKHRDNAYINGLFHTPKAPPAPKPALGGVEIVTEAPVDTDGEVFKGAIKLVKQERGFGFVVDSNTKEDIFFFHANVLNNAFSQLVAGDHVEYAIAPGLREGTVQAINIRKL